MNNRQNCIKNNRKTEGIGEIVLYERFRLYLSFSPEILMVCTFDT